MGSSRAVSSTSTKNFVKSCTLTETLRISILTNLKVCCGEILLIQIMHCVPRIGRPEGSFERSAGALTGASRPRLSTRSTMTTKGSKHIPRNLSQRFPSTLPRLGIKQIISTVSIATCIPRGLLIWRNLKRPPTKWATLWAWVAQHLEALLHRKAGIKV